MRRVIWCCLLCAVCVGWCVTSPVSSGDLIMAAIISWTPALSDCQQRHTRLHNPFNGLWAGQCYLTHLNTHGRKTSVSMRADTAKMRALTNMSSNQQVNWDKSYPGERSCACRVEQSRRFSQDIVIIATPAQRNFMIMFHRAPTKLCTALNTSAGCIQIS